MPTGRGGSSSSGGGRSLTVRASASAAASGLGAWRWSDGATAGRHRSSNWFFVGAVLLAVGVTASLAVISGIATLYGSGDGSGAGALSWILVALGSVLVVAMLAVSVGTLKTAVELRRSGAVTLHLFQDGLVLERAGGRVMAARGSEVTAELLAFTNSDHRGNVTWEDRMALLSFPDASRATVFHVRHPRVARDVAAVCGAITRRVELREAVDLQNTYEWR